MEGGFLFYFYVDVMSIVHMLSKGDYVSFDVEHMLLKFMCVLIM